MSCGEPFQVLHHAEVTREALAAEERIEELDRAHLVRAGAPVVRAEVDALGEGAGQQTVGERPVRHDADAVLAAVREDLALHAPVEHVPAVLGDVDAPHTPAGLNLLAFEVRNADEARLSLTDDVLEGAHRLFERRLRIGPVHQVDVDAVGAEVREALFDRGHDPRPAGIAQLRLVPVADTELRDDDDVLSPPAERPRERAFRGAESVALGGVEAVDAEVERPCDGACELRLLDLPIAAADLPAAEADHRDLESRPTEWSFLHWRPPSDCARVCEPQGVS